METGARRLGVGDWGYFQRSLIRESVTVPPVKKEYRPYYSKKSIKMGQLAEQAKRDETSHLGQASEK